MTRHRKPYYRMVLGTENVSQSLQTDIGPFVITETPRAIIHGELDARKVGLAMRWKDTMTKDRLTIWHQDKDLLMSIFHHYRKQYQIYLLEEPTLEKGKPDPYLDPHYPDDWPEEDKICNL